MLDQKELSGRVSTGRFCDGLKLVLEPSTLLHKAVCIFGGDRLKLAMMILMICLESNSQSRY